MKWGQWQQRCGESFADHDDDQDKNGSDADDADDLDGACYGPRPR